MERKVKVAAVSYLNTKPLLYGFRNHPVMERMELSMDYPAKIAQQLVDGEVDVALVPVAIIPKLKEYHIIADYCIGAEAPVASVCLYSDVPLHDIKRIYLDYQSRTSVALLKVLVREYWKLDVEFVATSGDYESNIKGTDAGLVIGDRALKQRKISPFIYDLAEHWMRFTSLPFVFAAWIANKELPADFIAEFNNATGIGLQNIPAVVAENPYDVYDLTTYYVQNISYPLTPAKRQGMQKFLGYLLAEQQS
ncbi:menaquinone biosynthetic enzyme MqnA/MqnD family protein [Chitinophaga sp. sic0106]|uniref:menaquinone biosynthetic enzyme MqnA/MqnD family protein n=1 Tax=Chitinophaga sp. sic0106 TaxID=2854785 RepID=UPI001C491DD8|nr:menaquinone biosynthesis protein [Chitinophaga sp. sic0106]MBV7529938.1 menaquinone biosynthesis protein [Chitinophaga sp. sic0106]